MKIEFLCCIITGIKIAWINPCKKLGNIHKIVNIISENMQLETS